MIPPYVGDEPARPMRPKVAKYMTAYAVIRSQATDGTSRLVPYK